MDVNLFLEKARAELKEVFEGLDATLQAMLYSDPFYGLDFYAHVFLKSVDKINSRKTYVMPRLVKPVSVPDTGLFKLNPEDETIECLYWLPQPEVFHLYKKNKALASDQVWKWIEDFKSGKLDIESLSEAKKEALKGIMEGKRPYMRPPKEIEKRVYEYQGRELKTGW